MLVNALFYIALLAAICVTAGSAEIAMARMTLYREAQTFVAPGYGRAMARIEQQLAADLQSGALPSPLPTFAPESSECANAGSPCSFYVSESITLSPTASDASNEQANAYVAEDRVAARIVVTVSAPDGTPLAVRAHDAVLRILKTAPYVVAAGARDATFDGVQSGAALGDDGGAPPATPNPCASSSAGTADDTEIRAVYENASTNACTDAGAWRSFTAAPATPPPWSP